ncbi:hypothetical protein C8T65DRAFT_703534 [Cerioporus squamosus]|nr:hypothetical protein C8T65DRAFT_703534 [Cerioporus squamosus]
MVRADWDKASEEILLNGLKVKASWRGWRTLSTEQERAALCSEKANIYMCCVPVLCLGKAKEHNARFTEAKVLALVVCKQDITEWLPKVYSVIAAKLLAQGYVWATGCDVVKSQWTREGCKVKKYANYNHFCTKAFPEYDTITELMGGSQAIRDLAFFSANVAAAAPVPLPPLLGPDSS